MASKGKASSKRGARRTKGGAVVEPASGGFWSHLPVRTQHLTLLAVLLAVSAVFFAPATFEGKTLVGSDTLQSRAMAKSMVDYHNETGEDALWATNLFSGMPGYLIMYPRVALQIDNIMFWFRRHLWPTAQFFLLLAGVYVLVYTLSSNPLAALIAALGAGLTTYIPIILAVGHTSKFMAISWAPWLMTAFVYILRKPRLIGAAVFAILLAVELRAGHPQITYYAAWLFGLWWIVEAVAAFRSGASKQFVSASAVLALGTVLAILMVAQPYWAQFEYKQFSTRGGGAVPGGESTGLAWDYAMNWSEGKVEILTLLIAGLFGGGSGTGAYWGVKPFTEGPHYLGGIILLLALIAIVGRRSRAVYGLTIGAFVLTLFSFGKHAAWFNRPFFDHFPLFSAFRAPEMWLHMVELSLAVLAGLGAAYLVGKDRDSNRKKNVLVSVGCVLGLSLFLTLGGNSMFSFERPGEGIRAAQQLAARQQLSPGDPAVQQAVARYLVNVKTAREDRFKSDAFRTTLILLLAAALIWLYFRGKVKPWALLSVLALLVLIDLWGVGKRHLTEANYTDGTVDDQIQEYGFDRFILDRIDEAGGAGHFRALSLEQSPVNWARPAFFYETSGGYNAAKLQVYQDFIDNIFFDKATGQPTLLGLDLSATRYVVSDHPILGLSVAYRDPSGWLVLERSGGRARTGFVGEFSVITDAEETYAALKSGVFDPELQAVVAEDPGISMAPVDSSSTVDVALETYGPREIVWDVETDAPRLLVTSEVFYPAGWKAFVDNSEVPILQTNHTFRSVAVPAGAHQVRMVFDPRAHELSSWIAIIATIFVYGWLVLFAGFVWFRNKKKHD